MGVLDKQTGCVLFQLLSVLWVEDTRFFTIFAQKLLIIVAILAVFYQVATATTATSVYLFFNYHDCSLRYTIYFRPLPRKVVYQVQTDRPTYALRKAKVTVCLDADDRITILYKNKEVDYKIFKKQAKQSEVLSSKDLDAKVDKVRKQYKPAPDHPWRKGFSTPLSKPEADISTLTKEQTF